MTEQRTLPGTPPQIAAVMTVAPESVAPEAALLEARRLMLEHRVHHLPVVRDERLVGIISDRDIKLILGPELDYPDPRELCVEDALIAEPYVVEQSHLLSDVVLTMARRHISAALVVRDGHLTGIFTATDACRVLGEWLQTRYPDDAA